MKRIGNLYEHICSLENLQLADIKARKGKAWRYGVRFHDRNRDSNILQLQQSLVNKDYRTSLYKIIKIYEPKERDVYRLPYYPDRITHHAVMNVLEKPFVSMFTGDSYSCIKGKGIHGAHKALKKALRDVPGTTYALKLDIRKFYPSIDHDILKTLLRKKFKDQDLLWLLDEIIDSAPGVPIGNYLSQYLANFYLTYFDHWIKEELKVKYYFRYADDILILSGCKKYLHKIFKQLESYLASELKLTVKGNWRVFPVHCGIDFLGYVYRHTHVLLRKGIKKNFARMLVRRKNRASIASYFGWACHANCNHLIKTLLNEAV